MHPPLCAVFLYTRSFFNVIYHKRRVFGKIFVFKNDIGVLFLPNNVKLMRKSLSGFVNAGIVKLRFFE